MSQETRQKAMVVAQVSLAEVDGGREVADLRYDLEGNHDKVWMRGHREREKPKLLPRFLTGATVSMVTP